MPQSTICLITLLRWTRINLNKNKKQKWKLSSNSVNRKFFLLVFQYVATLTFFFYIKSIRVFDQRHQFKCVRTCFTCYIYFLDFFLALKEVESPLFKSRNKVFVAAYKSIRTKLSVTNLYWDMSGPTSSSYDYKYKCILIQC